MGSVEEQLGRELRNGVEETILLIERFCEPAIETVRGRVMIGCVTWHRARDKNILVPGRFYSEPYTGLQAWKSQLDKAGVTIVETFDYEATASTIIALFNNAQEPTHTTLRRYIKERIHVETPNEHVISLMGIKGGGLGEAKAKALIERYGTFWYTLQQPAEELAETLVGEEGKMKRLGMSTVERLFKAIGRNQ